MTNFLSKPWSLLSIPVVWLTAAYPGAAKVGIGVWFNKGSWLIFLWKINALKTIKGFQYDPWALHELVATGLLFWCVLVACNPEIIWTVWMPRKVFPRNFRRVFGGWKGLMWYMPSCYAGDVQTNNTHPLRMEMRTYHCGSVPWYVLWMTLIDRYLRTPF